MINDTNKESPIINNWYIWAKNPHQRYKILFEPFFVVENNNFYFKFKRINHNNFHVPYEMNWNYVTKEHFRKCPKILIKFLSI